MKIIVKLTSSEISQEEMADIMLKVMKESPVELRINGIDFKAKARGNGFVTAEVDNAHNTFTFQLIGDPI